MKFVKIVLFLLKEIRCFQSFFYNRGSPETARNRLAVEHFTIDIFIRNYYNKEFNENNKLNIETKFARVGHDDKSRAKKKKKNDIVGRRILPTLNLL